MSQLFLTLGNQPAPKLVDGLPQGLPLPASEEQQNYAQKLYTLRQKKLGSHLQDGTGDAEDFWEMCARLHAAHYRTTPIDGNGLAIESKLEDFPTLTIHERLALPRNHGSALVPYGPVPVHSSLWLANNFTEADRYPFWPGFAQAAGRWTSFGGVWLEDKSKELSSVIASWASTQPAHTPAYVIVKPLRAKHGLWKLEADTSVKIMEERIMDALGARAMYFEGQEQAFSVQEYLPMAYEYRFFVVGGKIVTGAGCIEEYTPLFATEAFDARMRRKRSTHFSMTEDELLEATFSKPRKLDLLPVETKPALLATYKEFASAVAQALPVKDVVIDVAWHETAGSPVVIECNGYHNAGLYASQPWRVTEALLSS